MKKLPETRDGLTKKVTARQQEFYITDNFFEDHTSGEVFVVVAKNGSTLSGLIDCWCIAVSKCLKLGADWDNLKQNFYIKDLNHQMIIIHHYFMQ